MSPYDEAAAVVKRVDDLLRKRPTFDEHGTPWILWEALNDAVWQNETSEEGDRRKDAEERAMSAAAVPTLEPPSKVAKAIANAYVSASRGLVIEAFGTDAQRGQLHAQMEQNRRIAEARRRGSALNG